ncbi:MAG: response regulator transcription factor [Silicimonas sp.]|nr:response regulator transcription factor [Silicimonas sp.]NND43390.1 response regulator transcription factor [Silicimonas sp.]NNL74278.1 response regulator transcription factor [Silicimonas sp.]
MNEPAAPLILVVDDARDIRDPLAQYLRKQGFRAQALPGAAEARVVIEDGAVDLVILDIMMPGENGLSLCRWIAGRGGPPVILLTAMADETDRVVGLELGADDYVVKPFAPRELLARIRAVLRRAPAPPVQLSTTCRRFSEWTFDPAARTVTHKDGPSAELTSGEARLLGIFLDNPRAVLSRDRLLAATAGRDAKPYDRAIDNAIGRLRRKLEHDPGQPRILLTEWGGGYVLAADVEDLT